MIYKRKSRLTARQQTKLIEHFIAGTAARAASEIIGTQVDTSISFYMQLRLLIANKLPSFELSGEGEVERFTRRIFTGF